MGYRSTWISDDLSWGDKVSDEFKEKYEGSVNFGDCISSKNEGKRYGFFDDDFFLELARNTEGKRMLIMVMGEDGYNIQKITLDLEKSGITVEYFGYGW